MARKKKYDESMEDLPVDDEESNDNAKQDVVEPESSIASMFAAIVAPVTPSPAPTTTPISRQNKFSKHSKFSKFKYLGGSI
jgi:hypothetical protein